MELESRCKAYIVTRNPWNPGDGTNPMVILPPADLPEKPAAKFPHATWSCSVDFFKEFFSQKHLKQVQQKKHMSYIYIEFFSDSLMLHHLLYKVLSLNIHTNHPATKKTTVICTAKQQHNTKTNSNKGMIDLWVCVGHLEFDTSWWDPVDTIHLKWKKNSCW